MYGKQSKSAQNDVRFEELLEAQTLYKTNKQAYGTINANRFLDECREYTKILGPTGISVYLTENNLVIFFHDAHVEPNVSCAPHQKDEKTTWITDFFIF